MTTLKPLEKLLSTGKISRREFLARASALGLAAAVSPALLSSPASASTPKKGGRFRQGLAGGSTTDSLDPATMPDDWVYDFNWQLRNNLVEIDYKGNAIPELAESWEPSADASSWVFNIRKGVEFHNGKSLGAEDAIYSINHHRDEKSKSAAKGLLDAVKDIKADGKHRVIFSLDGGNADFPSVLSEYHFTISPAGTTGKEWEKGIGTGCYQLVEFEPGVRGLTKRFPNSWKPDRGHFDEVETFSISDINARTNAVKTGQIDYMNRCELKTVRLLEKVPSLQIIRSTGGRHNTMPMHTPVRCQAR